MKTVCEYGHESCPYNLPRSKLKKRLRKKFHVGEYRCFGFRIVGLYPKDHSPEQNEAFMDKLIDFCEAHEMTIAGGSNLRRGFDFIVEVDRLVKAHPKRYKTITATEENKDLLDKFMWDHCTEFDKMQFGKFVDLHHGHSDEWDQSVPAEWEELLGYKK